MRRAQPGWSTSRTRLPRSARRPPNASCECRPRRRRRYGKVRRRATRCRWREWPASWPRSERPSSSRSAIRCRYRASASTSSTLLTTADFEVSGPEVVPDKQERISEAIVGAIVAGADFVVTTGGTGLGPRDVTPQATSMLIDYEVPGLSELMRRAGTSSTPMASLSRGVAGVRGHSLILNVPGSMKGATESLEAVLPVLGHAIQLLHGHTGH